MVTRHTGIPMMLFRGAYPPCSPAVYIAADINPFCAGETVTFTPTLVCLDDAVSYSWIVESVEVSTSADPYATNTLVGGNRVILKVVNSLGQSIYSNMIIVQEKTEGCEELGLELTFDDIANVPVADASSVSDWNTFFDLPVNGTPFTSVVVDGNKVTLIGGENIHLKDELFKTGTYNLTIISIIDTGGCVISAGDECFFLCSAVEVVTLPAVTILGDNCFNLQTMVNTIFTMPLLESIGSGCFTECSGTTDFNFPLLKSAGEYAFALCHSCPTFDYPLLEDVGFACFYYCNPTEISIISCTNLGGSVVDDTVFFNDMAGMEFTLTIPIALMTCNGGNPDGDIEYLQDPLIGHIVTIITV